MADWEDLGMIAAKTFNHAQKDIIITHLYTTVIGGRVMYRTTEQFLVVKDGHERNGETFNAKFSDKDGQVYHLNVPYWD